MKTHKYTLLLALILAACSDAGITSVGRVCEERFVTLFTEEESTVLEYGEDKINYRHAGPFFGYDEEGQFVTIFYATWVECEDLQ